MLLLKARLYLYNRYLYCIIVILFLSIQGVPQSQLNQSYFNQQVLYYIILLLVR